VYGLIVIGLSQYDTRTLATILTEPHYRRRHGCAHGRSPDTREVLVRFFYVRPRRGEYGRPNTVLHVNLVYKDDTGGKTMRRDIHRITMLLMMTCFGWTTGLPVLVQHASSQTSDALHRVEQQSDENVQESHALLAEVMKDDRTATEKIS